MKKKYLLKNNGSSASCGTVIFLNDAEKLQLELYINQLNKSGENIQLAPFIELIDFSVIENDKYIQGEFKCAIEFGDYKENEFDNYIEKNVWLVC